MSTVTKKDFIDKIAENTQVKKGRRKTHRPEFSG